jgi:acetyltransferase-like isoleucine patch superfamily enzyme
VEVNVGEAVGECVFVGVGVRVHVGVSVVVGEGVKVGVSVQVGVGDGLRIATTSPPIKTPSRTPSRNKPGRAGISSQRRMVLIFA